MRNVMQHVTGTGGSLILDTYPAEAAYSFRLIRSSYSGFCVKVRRSGDNATQNIGFLNGALDAVSLLSFIGLNDGFIEIWYDQSGNARNVTNTTLATQPRLATSGVVETNNGKTAINANVALNILEHTVLQNIPSASFISVYNNTSTLNVRRPAGFRATTTLKEGFAQDSDNSLRFEGGFQSGSIGVTTGNKIRFSQRSTTQLYDYINNVQNINTSTVLPNINGYLNILNTGNTLNAAFVGYFQEVIFYFNEQLANRAALQTNLNNYYSIY